VIHHWDAIGPALRAFPEFLKEKDYQDLTDAIDTPFQAAWNLKGQLVWALMEKRPDFGVNFNKFMAVRRLGMRTWLDIYPYEKETEELHSDQKFSLSMLVVVSDTNALLSGKSCQTWRRRLFCKTLLVL